MRVLMFIGSIVGILIYLFMLLLLVLTHLGSNEKIRRRWPDKDERSRR